MPNKSPKSNSEIARHPLAIAWDEWLASDEGRSCRAPAEALSREGPYLDNRLHCAFDAGASSAESSLAEKVLEQIADERDEADCEYSRAYNDAIRDVDASLRDLFTRLNVKLEE